MSLLAVTCYGTPHNGVCPVCGKKVSSSGGTHFVEVPAAQSTEAIRISAYGLMKNARRWFGSA